MILIYALNYEVIILIRYDDLLIVITVVNGGFMNHKLGIHSTNISNATTMYNKQSQRKKSHFYDLKLYIYISVTVNYNFI